MNGDGFADMLTGAPGAGGANRGEAYLVYGKAGSFPADMSAPNAPAKFGGGFSRAFAGSSVAAGGDINGDGFADFLISVPNDKAGVLDPPVGGAFVVFGQAAALTGGSSGVVHWVGNGILSVASAGDFNGDGFDDVIFATRAAETYVVFGKVGLTPFDLTTVDGTNGLKITGDGNPAALAGDVNNDGLDDLIVGNAGTNSSYVIFGRMPDGPVDRTGTDASQNLVGGNFDDTLNGLGGDDHLHGNGGNDLLIGGPGHDTLDGGEGEDTASYAGAPGAVSIDLRNGTGALSDAQGDVLIHIEDVVGSAFSDVLIGDAGGNRLSGGDGNDALWGGAGADVLDGGADLNTAYYDTSSGPIQVNLAAGQGLAGDAHGDVLINIQNVVGSAFGDVLTGDAGSNQLYGGAGNDFLIGGAGPDLLDGGAGEDTVFYDASPDAVRVDLSAGFGTFGDAQSDVFVSIEDVVGSAFSDVLIGDAGANRLIGGDGNDAFGGRGGPDFLDGGSGENTAYYDTSAGPILVNLAAGTGIGGDADGDTLANIQDVVGSNFADVLIGDSDRNVLTGGGGDDSLTGGAGPDVLDGGAGTDTAFYDTSPDAIQVNLAVGQGLASDANGDILIGIENVVGSNFGDVLFGDANNNRITGGGGADLLAGNGGNDTFVFTPGAANGDQIVDFDGAGAGSGDVLEFSGYGAGATFTQLDTTHWQVNYNGNTQHDVITFQNGAAVHPSDVVFV